MPPPLWVGLGKEIHGLIVVFGPRHPSETDAADDVGGGDPAEDRDGRSGAP